jgi:hypothetical protein
MVCSGAMRLRDAVPFVLTLAACSLGAAPVTRARADEVAVDLKARGNEKMIDSDFVGAIEDYRAAIAKNPDDLALYYNVGRAEGLLGRYPESLAALETFASRAPPALRAKINGFDELLAEARRRVGYLTIACAVPNAQVQLGSEVVGAAPLTRRAVRAGEVVARIEAEGYVDDVRTVDVAGEQDKKIECRLLPKSTSGALVVSATPPGVRIAIDGTFRGNDRIEVPLHSGPHTVAVELAGYESTSTTVLVQVGATKSLDLPLRQRPVPILARWWFWTGAAVIVAGGVVAGVAALTEKPADKGTIPPHQLGTELTF